MKLYTNCKSCQKAIYLKSGASTRPDLEDERGERFQITCTHCGIRQEKHVNNVRAKANNLYSLIGLLVSLVIGLVVWLSFDLIASLLIAGAIPLIILKVQRDAVSRFNTYRVRRS